MTNIDTLTGILDRGQKMARAHKIRFNRLSSAIDMHNAMNQYPIDLEALLAADDMNFAHDFFGIGNHMDRKTGKLVDCFVPRFTRT